ncbi:unnamed protein product [Acanthoscelides obtectus]|uniref:Uncharacterized protein n=1 Tax=Acanthoscelides obtectus TaxID=200917 RepID=A0A9P0K545_ACAOB|nr:unnamed protein product [Acanthoscelides obtectus]CAK1665933.1 hypothetical protein AOBTE_LOCUS25056 [Acanthoscelides obtectus]
MERSSKNQVCYSVYSELEDDGDIREVQKTEQMEKARSPIRNSTGKYNRLQDNAEVDFERFKKIKGTPSKTKMIRKRLYNMTKSFLQKIHDKHVQYKELKKKGKNSSL